MWGKSGWQLEERRLEDLKRSAERRHREGNGGITDAILNLMTPCIGTSKPMILASVVKDRFAKTVVEELVIQDAGALKGHLSQRWVSEGTQTLPDHLPIGLFKVDFNNKPSPFGTSRHTTCNERAPQAS